MLPIRLALAARPPAPSLARARDALQIAHASRTHVLLGTGVAIAGALLAYLLLSRGGINALAEMTERTIDARFNFGGIGTYLRNVRDALIPLAVPLAGLAAVLIAFLMFTGNPRAQQIGGAIVIALGLAFFSPNIIN